DFTMTPAKGFEIREVMLELQTIGLGVAGKDWRDVRQPRFAALKAPAFTANRKDAFDFLLKKVPARFSKAHTDTTQPIKIGMFEGFEALGSIYNTEHDFPAFRYTAVVFVNDSIYAFEGIAPVDRQKEFEGPFREMTRSFSLRARP